MSRFALGLLMALCLSGCPSLTERAGLPPSVDRAAELEASGDQLGAARVYSSWSRRTAVPAQRFPLRARRVPPCPTARGRDAELGLTESLAPELRTERALLGAEALDRGRPQGGGEPAGGDP
jgi:hypothetical protein